ncbi:MAG: hypothetical protein P8Y45_05825 [Exilibacterium sp.]
MDGNSDNSVVRYNLAYAHALNREYEQAGAVLNTDFARTTEQVPEAYILAARMKHFLADIKTAVKKCRVGAC